VQATLDFLQRIYRSAQQPMSLRMRAAIEALPFEKPKLSATAIATMDGKTFAEALDRAIERSQNPPMLNSHKTIEHEELVPASELKKPFAMIDPVTCWGHPTAEELEASAKIAREKIAIWRLYGEAYYRDVYKLNEWMWRLVMEQAKEEVAKEHPDWVR
jgi:hypothetical protein